MFVLGIDPGLSRCGYGLVTRAADASLQARAAGVLETDPHDELPHRLWVLDRELRGLIVELRPDVVAVERVFFQVNAKTAMSVGQASGLALVGYGAATKEQIQRMVARVLALPAVEGPPDVADALALAVCHLTTVPLRRAVDAALDHPSGSGRRGRAIGGSANDEFSNVRSLR